MRFVSRLDVYSKLGIRGASIVAAIVFAAILWPPNLQAQQVAAPTEGRQYFSVGLNLNPGFLSDPGAQTGDYAFTTAGMLQLGMTHLITRHFFMSAEAQAGVQWMRANSAAKDGAAPSSSNFAWQVGIYGHWLPFGRDKGWVASPGIHLFRAHLDDAPLQVLAAELRLGRYIWSDEEHFLLIQAGYSFPFIQGLAQPTDFENSETWAQQDWTFHRFSIGFEYGF